ncbi:putative Galactoside O-acetyltransferase [uncultured delta proteobacterium]|uniref:Putative Galactoside O-acetyltransferase n=1 Tax=uncultured delta proteobacterium TaxID=34034 RepID=A0A212KGT3_9DELT|nr:putative Galactoside O-acetyltransferase [uncultured delta proteobacterium]
MSMGHLSFSRYLDTIANFLIQIPFFSACFRGKLIRLLLNNPKGTIVIEHGVKLFGLRNIEVRGNIVLQKNTVIDATNGYVSLGPEFNAFPNTTILAMSGKFITKDHVWTARDVDIYCAGGEIILGNNFSLNQRSLLHAGHSSISIGDDCLLGYDVKIFCGVHDHGAADTLLREAGMRFLPVIVGDDVWIASNVLINPGVAIGSHCVIGAYSVVLDDIPDYSFCAGIPARVKKSRIIL